jgi:hypothetical protein
MVSSLSPKLTAPRSSSCDGLPTGGARFEKLSVSSGILAHLKPSGKSKTYEVELSDLTVLELIITPDVSGGMARASVKSLRVS